MLKKLLFSACLLVSISGACFVANAIMAEEDAMTPAQVDNANALMGESPLYECLNDTEDQCKAICPACGNITYLPGTGRVAASNRILCPRCGQK